MANLKVSPVAAGAPEAEAVAEEEDDDEEEEKEEEEEEEEEAEEGADEEGKGSGSTSAGCRGLLFCLLLLPSGRPRCSPRPARQRRNSEPRSFASSSSPLVLVKSAVQCPPHAWAHVLPSHLQCLSL